MTHAFLWTLDWAWQVSLPSFPSAFFQFFIPVHTKAGSAHPGMLAEYRWQQKENAASSLGLYSSKGNCPYQVDWKLRSLPPWRVAGKAQLRLIWAINKWSRCWSICRITIMSSAICLEFRPSYTSSIISSVMSMQCLFLIATDYTWYCFTVCGTYI